MSARHFKNNLKIALENCVLCRGANSAAESYQYAEKMHTQAVNNLKSSLQKILESGEPHLELSQFISEL